MGKDEDRDPVQLFAKRMMRETAMASLYLLEDGEEVWFPKSVIEDEDPRDNGTIVLSVAAWFAEKEGLE